MNTGIYLSVSKIPPMSRMPAPEIAKDPENRSGSFAFIFRINRQRKAGDYSEFAAGPVFQGVDPGYASDR